MSTPTPAPPLLHVTQLDTARLTLRAPKMEDAEDLFEYAKNPEYVVNVLWEHHKTIDDSKAKLQQMVTKIATATATPTVWAMELKETGKFLGFVEVGLTSSNPNSRIAEIAYGISDAYWGRGLVTEAVAAVRDFVFADLGLERLQGRCFPDNPASERVLQKLGMQYEGTLRHSVLCKGVYRDLNMYSLLRGEWEKMVAERKVE